MKLLLLTIFIAINLSACVYPGISLNKGHLLDPTMDPAKTGSMPDAAASHAQVKFERSSISGGGSSGSACPTCR